MTTILHRLSAWAASDPKAIAQTFKREEEWVPLEVQEMVQRIHYLALFLASKGVTSADIGSILSYNCCEWVHTELALLLLGAKSAGIYPNSTGKDILYVLNHTESKVLAVQNKDYFKKIGTVPPQTQIVLVFDGDTTISPLAVGYEDAIHEGKKLAQKEGSQKFEDFLAKIDPHQAAFIIYTSGTTGNPKGALLSHDNLVYTIDCAAKHWKLGMGQGTLFSFLPLCHIAEKLQNLGAGISQRYTVNFCSKFENVSVELPLVQPRLLLCVPRVWEKMMEGVMKKIHESPLPRKLLALWALKLGARISEAQFAGKTPLFTDQVQWVIADRLVLSSIRQALGLSQVEALASGAAALPSHVYQWFRSLGLEIMEDFGQTESTGVICMTERGVDCAGTVGKAVPGMEVKIAEDGELLTRGRHVFKGYHKDDAATAQVLEGGWLHTGDLAEMDSKGYIRIRGRKKEVLKTSGGKMIAPLPIEEKLKASPLISQVCMVGDGRKYLSALITLSEAKLAELAKLNGSLGGPIITSPQVVGEVQQAVDELNASLASFEQIKKFVVLSREFSIAEGEMTPTLKMKRNVIETKYAAVINQLYEKA